MRRDAVGVSTSNAGMSKRSVGTEVGNHVTIVGAMNNTKTMRNDLMKIIPITEGMKGKELLRTDGALHIIFLGVGSSRAKRNFQTNFLLVKGNHCVVVDLGRTSPEALSNLGLELGDIDIVTLTHGHADHIGAVEQLALDCRYVYGKKPTLIVTPEWGRVLWEHSLSGGLMYNEQNQEGRPMSLTDYFNVRHPSWFSQSPRETWISVIGSHNDVIVGSPTKNELELRIFRTKHTPNSSTDWSDSFLSHGLFVDRRIFMSCDTRFDAELVHEYRTAEWFFHDVQFFPGAVHAPLLDLKSFPPEIKSRMMLKHYSDDWEKQDISDFAGFAQQGVIYRFE